MSVLPMLAVELLRKHCCFKRVGFKITKISKGQVAEDQTILKYDVAYFCQT